MFERMKELSSFPQPGHKIPGVFSKSFRNVECFVRLTEKTYWILCSAQHGKELQVHRGVTKYDWWTNNFFYFHPKKLCTI